MMDREAYTRARQEATRDITGEMVNVECVCPDCGVIYRQSVFVEFARDPDIWKRAGYPVILCASCDREGRQLRGVGSHSGGGVPCPQCGHPLMHRVLSNQRWCANPGCSDYQERPPIEAMKPRQYSLDYAMGNKVWNEVQKDIAKERGRIVKT